MLSKKIDVMAALSHKPPSNAEAFVLAVTGVARRINVFSLYSPFSPVFHCPILLQSHRNPIQAPRRFLPDQHEMRKASIPEEPP